MMLPRTGASRRSRKRPPSPSSGNSISGCQRTFQPSCEATSTMSRSSSTSPKSSVVTSSATAACRPTRGPSSGVSGGAGVPMGVGCGVPVGVGLADGSAVGTGDGVGGGRSGGRGAAGRTTRSGSPRVQVMSDTPASRRKSTSSVRKAASDTRALSSAASMAYITSQFDVRHACRKAVMVAGASSMGAAGPGVGSGVGSGSTAAQPASSAITRITPRPRCLPRMPITGPASRGESPRRPGSPSARRAPRPGAGASAPSRRSR